MCGRYVADSNREILMMRYGVEYADEGYIPQNEVFPTHIVPIIINNGQKQLKLFKWGFYPSGGKTGIINARSETLAEKNLFKGSLYKRRCLIPANAFFEWKKDGSKKIKYRISFDSEDIFSMAGIYCTFADKNNNPFTGFVIITTSANSNMEPIHDRMPVILDREMEDKWINSSINGISEFKDILGSFKPGRIYETMRLTGLSA